MKDRILLGVALIILTMPLALSFNCNSLTGDELTICNQINSLNLTSQERDIIASSAFYPEKDYPSYGFVYSWNTNLNIENNGFAQKYNQGSIKDAWLKILTAMPSVLINNTLYCDSQGKLQTEYNYRIELPSGTERSDCRTDYSLISNNSRLDVYLNDILQGNQKLTQFTADNSDNLNFKANLNIFAKIQVEHYQTYRYCCRRVNGYCTRYCSSCRYSNTETRNDNLVVTDNFSAKQYKENPESQFNITNQYYNVTSGILKASNFTSLILDFNQSSYQYSKYLYYLNYSLAPYYLLTVRAEPASYEKSDNIRINRQNDTINFLVSNAKDCIIKLFTPFREIDNSCNLNFQSTDFYIKTDKFYYNTNDTIKVQIFPSDIPVSITYNNITKNALSNTEFTADSYSNRILASYQGQQYEKLINVTRGDKLLLAVKISILGFIAYFTFSILTKPSLIRKWTSVEY